MKLTFLALVLPAAFANSPAAAAEAAASVGKQQYHCVELYNSETATLEQVLGVFEKLGVEREKVMPLIENVDKHGKAVVVAGTKESCEKVAESFAEINMKAEVRLLTKDDIPKQEAGPSEYDDSDVIVTDADSLNELLSSGEGMLINFYAPWCGHCKTMVPAYKEAATKLKESGVKLLAMDGQAFQGVARQLGVRAYPALKWLKLEGERLVVAEYQGGRDAASIIRFVEAAKAAGSLKTKLPQGAEGAEAPPKEGAAAAAEGGVDAKAAAEGGAAASKLGGSKLAGSKLAGEGEAKPTGVQKAKMPAAAEASAEPAAAAA